MLMCIMVVVTVVVINMIIMVMVILVISVNQSFTGAVIYMAVLLPSGKYHHADQTNRFKPHFKL